MAFVCAGEFPAVSLVDAKQPSLRVPRIGRGKLPQLAKLTHLLLLVSSDSEVRARFPHAQQDETGFVVFGQINHRIALVDVPFVLKPSRTSQTITLVTESRQYNPSLKSGVPNVFVAATWSERFSSPGSSNSAWNSFRSPHRFQGSPTRPPGQVGPPGAAISRVVKTCVLAVGCVPRFAPPEVARGDDLSIAFVGKQFNKPLSEGFPEEPRGKRPADSPAESR
jgi:hypothetical protein